MAKRKKKTDERLIIWRNGRAYGDFRSYEDVGGSREALAEPGKTWGTTDTDIANALYDVRLAALKEKRKGRAGVTKERHTTLDRLVQQHLIQKAKADLSTTHLNDLETRLAAAMDFFGTKRDPRTIEPSEVREWADHLGADGTRKPGTIRHYLNALSGLYGRAQEGLYVVPGYNPVRALQEKPGTVSATEATFFEVADAALILEAARILDRDDRKNATPGLYPLIATFLLTGGRRSEVFGLDVDDVSFDRGLIRFRPNAHRRLKTSTSHRVVPIWPQLRDLLQEWMFGGDQPRTSGLLFPSVTGSMITSIDKTLDEIGELCGMEAGEIRLHGFRHTYCSARLQTVQRILRPGADPADEHAFDYVEVSRFQVQKEMGHGGGQLVNRIYGHAQRLPYRSEAVEYRVEQHVSELGPRLKNLEAAC